MGNIFELMFDSLSKDVEAFAKTSGKESVDEALLSEMAEGQGSIDESFHLDDSGSCHCEVRKKGYGKTLHCTAFIKMPPALYTIEIKSSDGGGGYWENVKDVQSLSFDIKTSLMHSTSVVLDIHSNVNDVDGVAHIDYTY